MRMINIPFIKKKKKETLSLRISFTLQNCIDKLFYAYPN